MEMYIHYKSLPQGKDLHDVIGELNEELFAAARLGASTWSWRTSGSIPSTPRWR